MMGVTTNNRFACLTYHYVGEGPDQYTVSEEQLRDHLALLKAEGYVVEGFEQLEARLRSGQTLADRYVVLTVDDGHVTSIRVADLLTEYGCQATLFVTRDFSRGKVGYIREQQIRELRRRGFSLGAHGTTHRKLTFMPEDRCVEELRESKRWLEDVLGENVRYMAAPGGFINARIMRLTHEEGYVLTGTCREWMNSLKIMTLPGEVNRVNIRRHFTTRALRCVIEGNLGFYLWRQARAAALAIPKQLLRE